MVAAVITDSRLPLVDIDAMEGPVGDSLRAAPFRLNIIAMMAHAETCVLPQLGVGRAVMAEQSLRPLARELLILLAARLDGCQYVWSQHGTLAQKLGATPDMLDALDRLELSSGVFDDMDKALLAFGAQVIRGGEVEDGVFERISRHLTAQEIIEAILAIGYYMTMNRVVLATRTPLEPGTSTPLMRTGLPSSARKS